MTGLKTTANALSALLTRLICVPSGGYGCPTTPGCPGRIDCFKCHMACISDSRHDLERPSRDGVPVAPYNRQWAHVDQRAYQERRNSCFSAKCCSSFCFILPATD
jgi:hypothetical protein